MYSVMTKSMCSRKRMMNGRPRTCFVRCAQVIVFLSSGAQ